MRAILSERNLVVVLFVVVFITFAFAREDSKKMEQVYIGFNAAAAPDLVLLPPFPRKLGETGSKDKPVPDLQ